MSWLDRAISVVLPAVPKPVVRYFARRYIAGPTMDDAFAVVRALAREGAMATLDILGEFVTTIEQAERNTRAYEELLGRVAELELADTHVSVKLTALGLLVDRAACLDRMRRLCAAARDTGNFVRIDMEDSRCTDATLASYQTLRAEFPGCVGVVLQSRLRRTLADVDGLTRQVANVRLCKGIYLEPRPIAYVDAEIIRSNFVQALELLLERGAYVGIATHDERLVAEALRLVRRFALGPDRYEFQMLLGVDVELRRILIGSGHRLRVYVPYGEQWYGYSVRRLRENPQIAGYAFKSILQRTPMPRA
jgi:proline dehydrogenase